MTRINKQKTALIVLGLLLFLAVGYIIFTEYSAWNYTKQLKIYQEGYRNAIFQIAQQAISCQEIPLNIENQTINIIAVECLQQTK
jgi:hypothetical protein